MSAKVLAMITPAEPWGRDFHCIVCDDVCELDNFEPFCSQTCKDNYDGPPQGEAWSGGFAPNH